MLLTIRGFKIRCYGSKGNASHYRRLYESYDDDRLLELECEAFPSDSPFEPPTKELQGSRSK